MWAHLLDGTLELNQATYNDITDFIFLSEGILQLFFTHKILCIMLLFDIKYLS